jgi:hypothetical protein
VQQESPCTCKLLTSSKAEFLGTGLICQKQTSKALSRGGSVLEANCARIYAPAVCRAPTSYCITTLLHSSPRGLLHPFDYMFCLVWQLHSLPITTLQALLRLHCHSSLFIIPPMPLTNMPRYCQTTWSWQLRSKWVVALPTPAPPAPPASLSPVDFGPDDLMDPSPVDPVPQRTMCRCI